MSAPRRIGILAYGSLIDDPGEALSPLIVDVVRGVQTPFKVEFARKSRTRGDAPTLIPVRDGGDYVQAAILVVNASLESAKDMIWRRETRSDDITKKYAVPDAGRPNAVRVEQLDGFAGMDAVLYTSIGANIDPLTAENLADLAITSVAKAAPEKDGISYLIAAKRNGIVTALSAEYEARILSRAQAADLHAALSTIKASQ